MIIILPVAKKDNDNSKVSIKAQNTVYGGCVSVVPNCWEAPWLVSLSSTHTSHMQLQECRLQHQATRWETCLTHKEALMVLTPTPARGVIHPHRACLMTQWAVRCAWRVDTWIRQSAGVVIESLNQAGTAITECICTLWADHLEDI